MHDHCSYDYAVIRVVPRVDREEFLNVGVIISCPAKDFLEARIELDERKADVRAKLEAHTDKVMKPYEGRINQLLGED